MSKNAVMPLDDYKGACDKIREKTETTDLIKSGEMPEKIDKVFEAGKEQGESDFWDLFQNYGKRTSYADAFFETAFEYIRPKYKIIPKSSYASSVRVFYNCDNLKKIEADYFDFSQVPFGAYSGSGFYNTFCTCGGLEEIEDIGLENQKYWQATFNWCSSLRKIARIGFRGDEVFEATFAYCGALEEVTFEGVIGTNGLSFAQSPLLTDATLHNIVGCLKKFREIVAETSIVPSRTIDVVEFIASETLTVGEKYTITYIDASMGNDATSTYTVATVNVPTVGSVVGIEMVLPHPIEAGATYKVYVYQDGANIMLYTPQTYAGETYAGETRPISISIVKAPTETRSITFHKDSVTKLETLTEGGKTLKQIANDKGWTVVEV